MHGVTTAIVAFIFAGVIWPHVVKHKVQFYAALLMVVFIILFDSLAAMFPSATFVKAVYGITGLLQIAAIVMLILSTGMSAKDLGGEVFHTIDVVRRGGQKETLIVPLTGEKAKSRDREAAAPAAIRLDPARDIAAEEAALDAAERAAAPAAPPAPGPAAAPALAEVAAGGGAAAPPAPVVRRPAGESSIPLEP